MLRVGDLQGAIDTHVHAGPDVRIRKTTSYELVKAASEAGMRALVLKNHHTSTVLVAAALSEAFPSIRVFGGLVLNDQIGGFNRDAVSAALKMGAAEIWMPTQSAEGDRTYYSRNGSGLTIFDSNGAIRPEVIAIVRHIAAAGVILGTGHLTPCEIERLVALARDEGVRSILVTHPEIRMVDMTVEIQRALAGPDLFFERCYARELFTRDWDGLADDIRTVGYEHTILATDLGQPDNPHPVEGLREMREQMARRGFSDSELDVMLCRNPAHVLRLE
jgi:hypothetical protein